MENTEYKTDNGMLLLTKFIFLKVLTAIIAHFKQAHSIEEYRDSQLFGFGNYDQEKPNLKNDLELVLRGYVNGKYLYNKKREIAAGAPVVKISREYRNLFFNYLGYTGIHEFVQKGIIDEEEKQKQLHLLQNLSPNEEFYYVMYYYGEDKKMTKGQLTIHNNWKTFDISFVYLNIKEEIVLYNLFGNIKQENNFVHFDSKYFIEKRKIEGAKMLFYVGMASHNERPILIGTYSSFDKYDHSIAGKILLMRVDSKQEMEIESKSPHFHPALCQELVGYRHIIPSQLPKELSNLSVESPYASIFGKVPNKYKTAFSIGNEKLELYFHIQKYHYELISDMEDVELENEHISIESKGQILELHFKIAGIFRLQKVSMYLSVYELFTKPNIAKGQFSGIDINNKMISGGCTCQILTRIQV